MTNRRPTGVWGDRASGPSPAKSLQTRWVQGRVGIDRATDGLPGPRLRDTNGTDAGGAATTIAGELRRAQNLALQTPGRKLLWRLLEAFVINARIEHIGLPAREPEGVKDGYVRVLDARVVFARSEPRPAYLLALPGGGALLEVYQANRAVADTADHTLAGWRHVALHVESIEAAREILAARGVRFSEPVKPAGGGGRVLFFQDPEGNLLHLVERPTETLA